MSLRYEAMPDAPNRVAFFYGPILLCAPLKKKADMPVLIAEIDDLLEKIEPLAGRPLTFRTKGMGRPRDVTLRPHYGVCRTLYTVYMDVHTAASFAAKLKADAAEAKRFEEIRKRTCDVVEIGSRSSEKEHNFKSSAQSYTDTYMQRRWRDARKDGFFEFDLKVDPGKPTDLMCTWWNDARSCEFDILVNGEKLTTVSIADLPAERFVDIFYPLDAKHTRGTRTVRVRFAAGKHHRAGRLFGCRTVRRRKNR